MTIPVVPIATTNREHRMPLATSLVDEQAAALIKNWIESLPPKSE